MSSDHLRKDDLRQDENLLPSLIRPGNKGQHSARAMAMTERRAVAVPTSNSSRMPSVGSILGAKAGEREGEEVQAADKRGGT